MIKSTKDPFRCWHFIWTSSSLIREFICPTSPYCHFGRGVVHANTDIMVCGYPAPLIPDLPPPASDSSLQPDIGNLLQ